MVIPVFAVMIRMAIVVVAMLASMKIERVTITDRLFRTAIELAGHGMTSCVRVRCDQGRRY